MMAVVSCDRRGVIFVLSRCKKGCLPLGRGSLEQVQTAVSALARHAYDGRTLLVPGIPEAVDDEAALNAAERFRDGLARRLTRAAA